jgi:hypothetical protein
MKVVKKWRDETDSDYLLTHKFKKFNSSTLGKRLYKIFDGKLIGASALRSIFLSDMYKDMPKLQKMQETAEKMGHTINTALTRYVKK